METKQKRKYKKDKFDRLQVRIPFELKIEIQAVAKLQNTNVTNLFLQKMREKLSEAKLLPRQ